MKRADTYPQKDAKGRPVMILLLPSAKTAKPGEPQTVVVVGQHDTCPIAAVRNLCHVVPATQADPLFSWRDGRGEIRPLTKEAALSRIKEVLRGGGWNSIFGHSFRIGGASFYLAKGVSPELVRIAGRWKSLAYETYVRAFEQIAPQHMGGLDRE